LVTCACYDLVKFPKTFSKTGPFQYTGDISAQVHMIFILHI